MQDYMSTQAYGISIICQAKPANNVNIQRRPQQYNEAVDGVGVHHANARV